MQNKRISNWSVETSTHICSNIPTFSPGYRHERANVITVWWAPCSLCLYVCTRPEQIQLEPVMIMWLSREFISKGKKRSKSIIIGISVFAQTSEWLVEFLGTITAPYAAISNWTNVFRRGKKHIGQWQASSHLELLKGLRYFLSNAACFLSWLVCLCI